MRNDPGVVVIGGGITGIAVALNLSQRGVSVALVEREPTLGGNAGTVCCKAVGGKCQFCGGCLFSDHMAAIRDAKGVQILTQTTVTQVKRVNGGFSLLPVGASGPGMPLHADAIILATGFDHVDAHAKGPYGYGILPNVITGHDLERTLREKGQTAYDAMNPRKIAFIQCVGSRDEHVGRGYCSQVCCRYALRLARLLRSRFPEAEITLFKMDIQTYGRDFAATWSASANEKIGIIAGLPAVIRRSAVGSSSATFLYDDILEGKLAKQDFDLVVLSVGMQPRRDAGEVADLFGINQTRYGFFATGGDETSTLVPGIFVAGSCEAPRSIAESISHARQAAEAAMLYLQESAS